MEANSTKIASYLYSAVRILRKISDPLSYRFLIVGAILLAGMMLLVATSVMMRYFINTPILGDMELIQIMLVGMASFSMAYCASTQSHVRVKALIDLIPYRPRSVINFLINLVTFGFILMVVRYSAAQGMVLWKRGFSTIIFNIPLFPFAFVLSLGFAVFAFVIFVDLIDSLAKVFDHEPP